MIVVRFKETKNTIAIFDSSHEILDVSHSIQMAGIDCSDVEYAKNDRAGSFVYSAPGMNICSQQSMINSMLPEGRNSEWHELPELNKSECWDAEFEVYQDSQAAERDIF